MVEAGGVLPNNETLKIKWRPKASEVEDEAIEGDSHLGMGITRMFSGTTVINLGTMPRIAGTK